MSQKKSKKKHSVAKYFSLLFQLSMTMITSILLFFGLGLYIERRLMANGMWMIGGTLLGVFVGFYAVFKVLSKVLR